MFFQKWITCCWRCLISSFIFIIRLLKLWDVRFSHVSYLSANILWFLSLVALWLPSSILVVKLPTFRMLHMLSCFIYFLCSASLLSIDFHFQCLVLWNVNGWILKDMSLSFINLLSSNIETFLCQPEVQIAFAIEGNLCSVVRYGI